MMTMYIVKFRLITVGQKFVVKMPSWFMPLSIELEHVTPYLHCVIGEHSSEKKYQFWCVCTGEKLPEDLDINTTTYLDTVKIGDIVHHYWYDKHYLN